MAEGVNLIFPERPRIKNRIGTLTLDATVREGHVLSASMTTYPVESGSNITDHVFIDPRKLTLEGEITDTPFVDDGTLIGVSRRFAAFEALENLHASRAIITVVTGLKVYTNMVLLNLSTDRDKNTGGRLPFVAEFQEWRVVSTRRVTIPKELLAAASKDIGQSKTPRGRQDTTEPTPVEDGKINSTLSGWLQ